MLDRLACICTCSMEDTPRLIVPSTRADPPTDTCIDRSIPGRVLCRRTFVLLFGLGLFSPQKNLTAAAARRSPPSKMNSPVMYYFAALS